MKFRATQSAPVSSTKTASSRLSRLKIGRLWVGATTWTRWRRCPHLPSGLNLTLYAHLGVLVSVVVVEDGVDRLPGRDLPLAGRGTERGEGEATTASPAPRRRVSGSALRSG